MWIKETPGVGYGIKQIGEESLLKSLERHEEGFVAPHQVGNPRAEGGVTGS